MDIFKEIESKKQIGTIGSPNRVVDFTMDIKTEAMNDAINSRLLAFIHEEMENGDNDKKIVLAIVTEMVNINPWHQNQNLKSIIRERGTIPYLSNSSNTIITRLQMLTALKPKEEELVATVIGTPPKSGTPVYEIPLDIFKKYRMKQKWYLGTLLHQNIPVPISIRHFGATNQNDGLGEAQFTGIFGKTGSGKSVFGTQVMAGYSRFLEMGMLVLDPQAQYYQNNFGDVGNFNWDFHGILKALRPEETLLRLTLKDLSFDSVDLFTRILIETGLAKTIASTSVGAYNEAFEANLLESMRNFVANKNQGYSIYDIKLDELIELNDNTNVPYSGPIINALYETYQPETAKKKSLSASEKVDQKLVKDKFQQIREMFNSKDVNRISIKQLVELILNKKMFIILNISNFKELGNLGKVDDIRLRTFLMQEILDSIVEMATNNYDMEMGSTSTPAMIVLDEAHYIVPQDKTGLSADQKALLANISSSVKTTRKYGIGWMFITQLITDFAKDIYKQLSNHYFLYGLQIGTDKSHVIAKVGSENIKMYDAIADPKATGKFPVMIQGPVVSFSSMQAPIILIGPNSDIDFIKLNDPGDNTLIEKFNQVKGSKIQTYSEFQKASSGDFSIVG